MPYELAALADLGALPFDEIVDVRSPGEFAEDHIPGALNLPVLDDAERARVGTIYVQESRFLARRIGAALVARNAAAHLEGPLAGKGAGWRPLVMCWRGGQRSGSLATILRQVGWQAETLAGGYRSYRRLVVRALYETPVRAPVVLIDGGTGTAKTRLLAHLARAGAQVIDLEALAEHRGSLFGATSRPQPSQKAFETRLAFALEEIDPARLLYLEAESSRIGRLNLPPMLWKAMNAARRVRIEAPIGARVAHLLEAYGDLLADPARIEEVLGRLVRFHGHEQVEAWRALAAAGDHARLAQELIERHYDPRYRRMGGEGVAPARVLSLDSLDDASLARAAARLIGEFGA